MGWPKTMGKHTDPQSAVQNIFKVLSIAQMVSRMDEKQIQFWQSLSAMGTVSQHPASLIEIRSLVRARFCELVAIRTGKAERKGEFFLTWALSMMDLIIGKAIPLVLAELPLVIDITAALLGKANPPRDALDLAVIYEQENLDRLGALLLYMNLPVEGAPDLYMAAKQWANSEYGDE